MISTGNDIVSLNAINVTRTKQQKFYSKILTPAETALHNGRQFAAIPFESFVWLLWSIKEAAFKFLQRANPALLFSPTKFEVKQLQLPAGFEMAHFTSEEIISVGFDDKTAIYGLILYENNMLYTRSLLYNELIMSVVNADDDFSNIHWGIKSINSAGNDTQSAAVREFLMSTLQLQGINRPIISKNLHSIPGLLYNGVVVPVSLSHHERFVAYSVELLGAG
jgi:phosphopantetheinyl transferase (holo-ACP synthase)